MCCAVAAWMHAALACAQGTLRCCVYACMRGYVCVCVCVCVPFMCVCPVHLCCKPCTCDHVKVKECRHVAISFHVPFSENRLP